MSPIRGTKKSLPPDRLRSACASRLLSRQKVETLVKVELPVNPPAAYPDIVKHDEADRIKVDDSHLLVQREGGTNVAIYAPSKWVSATVAK